MDIRIEKHDSSKGFVIFVNDKRVRFLKSIEIDGIQMDCDPMVRIEAQLSSFTFDGKDMDLKVEGDKGILKKILTVVLHMQDCNV